MDNMTLSDRRSHHFDWARKATSDEKLHNSRLPTPDTSRSSYEGGEDDKPQDSCNIEPGSRALMFPPISTDLILPLPSIDEPLAERRDSQQFSAPQSPSHQESKMQRPSLPPLKTFLNNLSSPPHTPTFANDSRQPSPHEALYKHSTFKPLSLYPNKKQRFDASLDHPSATSTTSRISSPGASGYRFDPKSSSESCRPTGSNSFAGHADLDASRRYSVPNPPSRPSLMSPVPNNSYSFPASAHPGSYIQSEAAHGGLFKRKLDQTATPDCSRELDRTYSLRNSIHGGLAKDHSEDYDVRSERPGLARSSSEVYNEYQSRNYDYPRPIGVHPDSVHWSSFGGAYGLPSPYGVGEPMSHPHGGFIQSPYSSGGPSYFMASPYDLHHRKARKRSNLPKQSTEIMKEWFDRNITNPYPSEEQKALFSSATGISMTQVSNWFINHRRRCPELRDKRERNRIADGEI